MGNYSFTIDPGAGLMGTLLFFSWASLGLGGCGATEQSSGTSATDSGGTATESGAGAGGAGSDVTATLTVTATHTTGAATGIGNTTTSGSSVGGADGDSTVATVASSTGSAGGAGSGGAGSGGAGSGGAAGGSGGSAGGPPDLEWCGEQVCVQGATCDEATGFCECTEGYTGDGWWCLSTSPCSDSPCLNGGVCHPTVGDRVLCTCPPGYGGVNCEVVCSGEIEFPDAAFASAVRSAGSIDAAEPITAEALAGITSISISDTPIADLTGIECMTSLSWVSMYTVGLTDLTPFAALPRLTDLGLPCNSISDLSPIASLVNLTSFSVGKSSACEVPGQVTDISPLADLVALATLDLSGHDIDSLTPLARLEQLEFLVLASNPNLASLAGLEALDHLEYFVVTDTQVSDLSIFENHPTLETLWLSGSAVSDLGPLLTADSLAELYIRVTPVDCQAQAANLAALAARGVTVSSDCE
ncbi:MAG TPA: hypothetical protein VFU02_02535 [Polyangiaceae bacterium]|nr:hypothetical protein [Polyangiaceae bacterium]